MRILTLVALLMLAPSTLWAQTVALLVGIEEYRELQDVRGADEVVDIRQQLADLGVQVIAGRDVGSSEFETLLDRLDDEVEDADSLIVVLAGQFAHSATETWFLPATTRSRTVADLVENDAMPLSAIMSYLARMPGRAFLVLGSDDESGTRINRFVDSGIGAVTPPQGVTLVQGNVRAVSRFVDRTLSRRGVTVRGRDDLTITGYAPRGLVMLEEVQEVENSDRDPNAGSGGSDFVDWRAAEIEDTEEAYRRYLLQHPRGMFANMARDRIKDLREEEARRLSPEDRARQEEDALNLGRDARRAIQRDLSLLDFNTRGIDGIFGQGTRTAIRSWQRSRSLPTTGFLNRAQIERLGREADRRAAELEREAEERKREMEARDRAYWDQTGRQGGAANLRAYLERFPDGIYSDRAESQLDEIRRANRQRANARDRDLWDRAQRQDDVRAYRSYLEDVPDGRFADDARQRIRQLTRNNENAQRRQAALREEDALNLSPITRRLVEERLAAAGFDSGEVDGQFDNRTRRAIRRYQDSRGLEVTGFLREDVVVRLLADSVRSIFQ